MLFLYICHCTKITLSTLSLFKSPSTFFFLNLAWTDGLFISCMLLGDFGLMNSFPENKKRIKNILNIKRPFCIKQLKKKRKSIEISSF